MNTALYKDFLREEYARRSDRNPRYSLRAFAKALGVDHATLSRIFSGERIPSYKMARKIFAGLGLNPQQEEKFLSSLAATQAARGLRRMSPRFKAIQAAAPQRELSLDLFRVIADWYHYAILELTFVEDFQSNPKWIAKALGISQSEATFAIQRLLDLELLTEENGRFKKSNGHMTTADKHLTNSALKRHQKQIMERAIDSLENDPIEKRSMTSMTMAIAPEKVPIAKEMIERFSESLCKFLEDGKQTRVYEFSICLYPHQKEGANP